MSELKLVVNKGSLSGEFSDLSDLKTDLETGLSDAKDLSDVEEVLNSLNQFMHRPDLDQNQRADLKRFRQKIYDRKKLIRVNPAIEEKPKSELVEKVPPQQTLPKPETVPTPISNFEKITSLSLYGSIALFSTWFLWKQSINLYSSSGFSEPDLTSFGGILMMVGFAALHAVSKSKLALLLCLYSSGYEIAFIVSGTMKNESVTQSAQLEKNPQLIWLKDQVERTTSIYQGAKSKIEDPDSKVYQNGWYKTKFVDPSWLEYSNAQKDFDTKQSELISEQAQDNHVAWLKVLYRLGLVFLAMLSVHLLLRRASSSPA